MRCYSTVAGGSVVTFVSITVLTNHILPWVSIFLGVCIGVSQKDCWFVRFNPSQDNTGFLNEFQVLFTWVITSQLKTFNYTHTSLGKPYWLNAKVEKFPTIFQLYIVRTTTLTRREANNIRWMSFGVVEQFVLFPCERSDVPVTHPTLPTFASSDA